MKQLEEVKIRADILNQLGDEGYVPLPGYKPADMKNDKGKKKGRDKTDGQPDPDPDEMVKKWYADIKRSPDTT